ncbi:MAG TPA: CRTAC1 family protein, partial [Candidatus Polarisedimenticolia bacterium]|nr:CRTAC1 family protein [Candidatus Polarisedimenticolia bacterium]
GRAGDARTAPPPPASAHAGPPPSPAGTPAPGGFRFTDVASGAGITRVVHAGRRDKDHLLDSAGTGAAWLDYDRDGRLDAYIVNGWRVEGSAVLERGRNALYRNRGDGTFEDVTDRARVTGEGHWGSGVAVADYDNDGWTDILVTNFGPNVLYRNRGDGTFENAAARAGIEAPGWNTGAAFFDADADGDLDLYVAAYIEATMDQVLAARPTLDWKGVDKVAFGPFGLKGAPDRFFRSDGRGRFTEETEKAGLADRALAFGFAVRAADFDGDGDQDLYVANDSDGNYVYRNDGGRFEEVGMWSGAALDGRGAAQASMGVAVGDANGDGLLDIVTTNFSEDFTTLYKGDGKGFFEDVSERSGVGPATYINLSWGTVLEDLDNDGDRDLVIANGHIYPQVDRHPAFKMTYAQPTQLLENVGEGLFVEATARAGPGFAGPRCARGMAAGDYDDDGDVDLLVVVMDGPPALLRNDSTRGHWLTVVLEPSPGSPPPIGAVVTVRAAGRVMVRDVASSDSYLSAGDPRLHFGLGPAAAAESVEVRWPGGAATRLRDVAADRFLTVRPGPP